MWTKTGKKNDNSLVLFIDVIFLDIWNKLQFLNFSENITEVLSRLRKLLERKTGYIRHICVQLRKFWRFLVVWVKNLMPLILLWPSMFFQTSPQIEESNILRTTTDADAIIIVM